MLLLLLSPPPSRPLVNLDGQVVAMNTMKAAPAAGVSFAIPIDTIKQLVSEMSRWGDSWVLISHARISNG